MAGLAAGVGLVRNGDARKDLRPVPWPEAESRRCSTFWARSIAPQTQGVLQGPRSDRLDDRRLTYPRRHVGFVFRFYNLIPSLTAHQNVALVTEIAERPLRADEALALVGLEARANPFRRSFQVASSSASRSRARWRALPSGKLVEAPHAAPAAASMMR